MYVIGGVRIVIKRKEQQSRAAQAAADAERAQLSSNPVASNSTPEEADDPGTVQEIAVVKTDAQRKDETVRHGRQAPEQPFRGAKVPIPIESSPNKPKGYCYSYNMTIHAKGYINKYLGPVSHDGCCEGSLKGKGKPKRSAHSPKRGKL